MTPKKPGKTRTAEILELAEREGGQFFLHQIYGAFGAATKEERRAVWGRLRALIISDKVERVGDQLYETKAKKPPAPSPMRDAIWRAIRANRVFALDDLMVQTDCSREYAKEYVLSLIHQGYVQHPEGKAGRRLDGKRVLALYRLVRDPVTAPVNTGKNREGK